MEENYDESKYKSEEKRTFKTFYWVLSGAIAVMIAAPILIHNLSGTNDSTRGSFGDMYGVVNALFSGLATGGVILAILLQRLDLKIQRQELRNSIEQLELQRDEMKLQRQEMQQSTAEIRAQKEILDRQNFEDKFFRLLENHKSVLKSVVYSGGFEGKDAFRKFSKYIFSLLHIDMVENPAKLNNPLILIKFYEETYINSVNQLSHYFRNLYYYINFIDNTNQLKNFEERYSRAKLLRANLSNYEILLLALNGASKYGKDFKDLIERYKLLKNLDYYSDIFHNSMLSQTHISHISKVYPHLQASFDEQRKNH